MRMGRCWVHAITWSSLLITMSCMVMAERDDPFGNMDRSDWVDPSDMLNYDMGTQKMRKSKVYVSTCAITK